MNEVAIALFLFSAPVEDLPKCNGIWIDLYSGVPITEIETLPQRPVFQCVKYPKDTDNE